MKLINHLSISSVSYYFSNFTIRQQTFSTDECFQSCYVTEEFKIFVNVKLNVSKAFYNISCVFIHEGLN
jgi:hypothetical protein